MATPAHSSGRDFVRLLAIVALPLAGAIAAGRPWCEFFQFPPALRIPDDYLKFSWIAAMAVGAAVVALVGSWFAANQLSPAPLDRAKAPARSLPGWGWAALLWTSLWWLVAWTRLSALDGVQRYTFFPLWLGFIVFVNALTQRRTGSCGLTRAPGRWLKLFGVSAVFWWLFEWLNRFVENWHYLAAESFGAAGYAVHASLCFSTVLPAVAAVAEWLESHTGWNQRVAIGPAWRGLDTRQAGWLLCVGALVALIATGAFPHFFYPALWVAPLALLLPGSRLVTDVAAGRWQQAATWMVAALLCGFFWEMWNAHSLVKWIYSVPGVERWKVFEMPLLGYAGYLPFGLECLLVAERCIEPRERG